MQSSCQVKQNSEFTEGGEDTPSAVPEVGARRFSDGLHVGLIMDGNGRWAARKGLPRHSGHKAGVEALRRVVEAAPGLGVGTITAYAFSVDNWSRPSSEVDLLMGLLGHYLSNEVARFVESGVRLSVIGRRDRLPGGVVEAIEVIEGATLECSSFHLRLAIDYSARDAILLAVGALLREQANGLSEGRLGAVLGRDEFSHLLSGKSDSGDVDLLIRTGGEKRLSDFLLWECAYAELHFCDRAWPDYSADDLSAAVAEFHGRERRFGGLGARVAAE